MKLSDLPDVTFADATKETVLSEILAMYKKTTGRQLASGDPIRLFILTMTDVVIMLLNKINETGRQNLLKYATGDNLDNLGILVGVARLAASAASTTVRFTLSAKQANAVVIPTSTRVSAGDDVFFTLEEPAVVLAGDTYVDAACLCTTTGTSGNGYQIGEITTLVDPQPYVATVSNLTLSQGGADIEDDDAYRLRIQEAPESFSCAGASGAYEYWAKTANASIADVAVVSPNPGEVVLYPILTGGEIPSDEILQKVNTVCNYEHVRPLTDQVSVKAPGTVEYTVDLTYYVASENSAYISTIQAAVDSAVDEWITWQRSALGRDLNPSELIRRIMEAGAKRVVVTSPIYTKVPNGSKDDGYAVFIAVCTSKTVTYGGLEDE